MCLIHHTLRESCLFSGHHLTYNPYLKRLDGFKTFNHGKVRLQESLMRQLATNDTMFQWILPGKRLFLALDLSDLFLFLLVYIIYSTWIYGTIKISG